MTPLALPLAVTLVVAPAQLKTEAPPPTALVTVHAPGAHRVRLWCSIGQLARPTRIGDDAYTATYAPPAGGKPARAVVAAWDEDSGELATATVALAVRTEIPVETDAGAQVVVVIHGRRSTAHANAAGHARVMAWVWPGEATALVTATDAAGNATTNEVALDVPRPETLFVIAPAAVAAGEDARVFAVAATGATSQLGATPQLAATPAALSSLTVRPGVAAARLRTRGEVTLTASAGGERVVARVPVAPSGLPPDRSIVLAGALPDGSGGASASTAGATGTASAGTGSPAGSTSGSPAALAWATAPPWEIGAAVSARYGGTVGGLAAVFELRRRLRSFAVGLDVDGHWATGTIGLGGTLAGFGVRAVAEGRLPVTPRVSLYLAAAVGGHYAHLWRTQPANMTTQSDDGGPTLATAGGVLWRVGSGVLDVSAGFLWSPLINTSLVNADGGALTVGYRVAR